MFTGNMFNRDAMVIFAGNTVKSISICREKCGIKQFRNKIFDG